MDRSTKYGLPTRAPRDSPDKTCENETSDRTPPGDCNHLTLLYDGFAAQIAAVAPFLDRGLQRDERCLYIAADNTKREIHTALRAHGIDTETDLDSGQLSIVTAEETYLQSGSFDRSRMLDVWRDAIATTTDEGYAGVRVAAEMAGIHDSATDNAELRAYEASLNDLFAGEDFTVLCQYHRQQTPADRLDAVVRTHPVVVADATAHHNPFYTPPEGEHDNAGDDSIDPEAVLHALQTGSDDATRPRRQPSVSGQLPTPFQALFANAPVPTIAYEFVEGDPVIRAVNPAFQETFQFDPDTVEGQPVNEVLVPPAKTDEARSIDRQVRRGERVDTEVLRATAAGDRYFRLQTVPVDVATGPDGFAMYLDITDRKQSQEALLSVLDRLPSAILVETAGREVLRVNDRFCNLFDIPSRDVVNGRDCEEMLEEVSEEFATPAAFVERTNEIAADRETVYDEEWQLTDGRVFDRSHIPVELSDGPGGLWVYRDASERAERLRQLRVLHRVLRHNLSNEMNLVQGHARRLQNRLAGEDATAASIIEGAADRLLGHIAKHRELVRVMSNSPSKRVIPLAAVVRQEVEELREAYPSARITVEGAEKVAAKAIGEVELAVREVVENAVVHNEAASPGVCVEIARVPERGTVRVRVEDDGPGVPEEEAKVLSGEQDVDPLDHGLGIGLWLVYWIVTASDGRVVVERNDQRGSVVTLVLTEGSSGAE